MLCGMRLQKSRHVLHCVVWPRSKLYNADEFSPISNSLSNDELNGDKTRAVTKCDLIPPPLL